ncbi:ribose-phosphate diphosphokinase [Halomarina oriensis]|uniref:ribose-phosphate diphosphokinase n=1 Tax=Halomarina oriensis TaxID=671145 RepID=A0A6B0GR62_9EURY|nr:ribose-phosphate diphosphokinase [Halomarina oriensis]MWG34615.1 ribose-phosphate diphosphokinase [Halomarina oriensis]
MILPGSASQSLAARLAAETDHAVAPVEYDWFADGELIARADIDADHAVVVASTTSSDAFVQLLQLQDVAERQAERVTTVLPYMGYARQDRQFKAGDPVSAEAMARAVSTSTDRVVTVTPHEPAVCAFFDVPCDHVDASGLLADPLPEDLTDPLFLAPDASARGFAESVRDAYGTGAVDHFEKVRDYDTGTVSHTPSETDATGRDTVVVDDIIATGSTMSGAIEHLQADGVGRVFATCVHPMLAANAQVKLARAGVEAVFGTDTIERSVSSVSVAPLVADAL